MGLFGDVVGGVLGAAGMAHDANMDRKNYRLQKSQLEEERLNNQRNYDLQLARNEYEKGVQATTWQREDNAMQRKVKDLEAAGINPVLAAGGSGSPTSAPLGLSDVRKESPRTVPQHAVRGSERAQMMINLMSQRTQVGKTDAERRLIELQQDQVKNQTLGTSLNNQVLAQEVQQRRLAIALLERDMGILAKRPGQLSREGGGIVALIDQITAALADKSAGSIVNQAGQAMANITNKAAEVVDAYGDKVTTAAKNAGGRAGAALKDLGSSISDKVRRTGAYFTGSGKTYDYKKRPNYSSSGRSR